MSELFIGWNAAGQPVVIPQAARRTTHMHVIGGSGTGKSKFFEWMIRRDIDAAQGLCVLDWHGTLYQNILQWCAGPARKVGLSLHGVKDSRSLILVDPSQPDYVTGFNPFMNVGADVAPQVNRRILATVKAWGASDTNDMPTLERIIRQVFTFAVENRETLPNVAYLLDQEQVDLRKHAMSSTTNSRIRAMWGPLLNPTTREWNEQALSTINRFSRFLTSKAICRFMGLPHHNLNLMEVMEKPGTIVLVNLAQSDFLSPQEARVFATLFLNEWFETAMRRAHQYGARGEEPDPFILYLDEFQEYITDDLAAMLDEVRKGGLQMVLAHQHLGHFVDNPRLEKSVFTNARIRAVFGGLDFEDAAKLANEMFLEDLNARQIAKAYWHTIHLYREEKRNIHSESFGTSQSEGTHTASSLGSMTPRDAVEGWFGPGGSEFVSDGFGQMTGTSDFAGSSDVEVPVFVPIPTQELGSEETWSREEKVSRVVQILKLQQQRHCYIRLNREKTQPLKVPKVEAPPVSPETVLEYRNAIFGAQGALPATEVDGILQDNERRFLEEARRQFQTPVEPTTAKRRVR